MSQYRQRQLIIGSNVLDSARTSAGAFRLASARPAACTARTTSAMVAAYTAPLIGPNVKPAQLTNGRALVISSRTATAMPIGLVGTYRIIQAASGAATTPPASIDSNTKPSTPATPSDPIKVKAEADATATSAVFTEPIANRGRTARF